MVAGHATGFNYVREAMHLLALKGWSNRVEWDLLTKALEEKRAIPMRISPEATGYGLQATGEASRPLIR